MWLTSEAISNEKTVESLQDVSIMVGDFLKRAQRPVVLIDGAEYLISNNAFESFLKFLEILRDRLQLHDVILLVPIAEGGLRAKMVQTHRTRSRSTPCPNQA